MRAAIAPLTAALLMFCACAPSSTPAGSPQPASSPTIPANVCAYISASEVGAVVGGPVNAGVVSTANAEWDHDPACVFTAQGTFVVAIPGSNADFQSASVAFLRAQTYANLVESPAPFGSSKPVSGFGDEAFEVAQPHYEVLFVRKGAYRMAFEVAAGFGSFFAPEEKLARIVLPRLPA